MKCLFYLLLSAFVFLQCRHKVNEPDTEFPGKAAVPASIKMEHEQLLAQVQQLTLLEDSAGRAAKRLQHLVQFHFREEEDYVFPQLGLLPLLAEDKLPPQKEEMLRLSEKLAGHLTQLNAEHQLIDAYVQELKQAAGNSDLPGIEAFEKRLYQHARIEEEVYFPAAILVAEYLKMKSGD